MSQLDNLKAFLSGGPYSAKNTIDPKFLRVIAWLGYADDGPVGDASKQLLDRAVGYGMPLAESIDLDEEIAPVDGLHDLLPTRDDRLQFVLAISRVARSPEGILHIRERVMLRRLGQDLDLGSDVLDHLPEYVPPA